MDDDLYVACSQTVSAASAVTHTLFVLVALLSMTFHDVVARYRCTLAFLTRHCSTMDVVVMSHILVVLAMFTYVHVANSDLSRIQTYPSRRLQPAPGTGRVPPLPAVPLPNYVLMTAASTGEFEPDNDLEVTHEFKLRVEAGNEMCLFQKVRQNARLYFSFKVCPAVCELVD